MGYIFWEIECMVVIKVIFRDKDGMFYVVGDFCNFDDDVKGY